MPASLPGRCVLPSVLVSSCICWKRGLRRMRAWPTSSGAELQVLTDTFGFGTSSAGSSLCTRLLAKVKIRSFVCSIPSAGRKLLAIRRSQERSSRVAVLPALHGRVRRRASLGIPSAAESSVTSWRRVSAVFSLNRSSARAKLHLQAIVPSMHQLRLKQLLHTCHW